VRPNFDEIVRLLMNEISLEIKTNDEPIFGSGRIIGASDQKDIELGDDTGISKQMYDSVVRDLDIAKMEFDKKFNSMRAEKEKLVKELQAELKKKSWEEKKKLMEEGEELKKKLQDTEKELLEIKLTGGARSGVGDDGGSTQRAADVEKAKAEEEKKKKAEEKKRKDDEANAEMAAMMAMLGR
jgi:seryl-tRNA synthetase